MNLIKIDRVYFDFFYIYAWFDANTYMKLLTLISGKQINFGPNKDIIWIVEIPQKIIITTLDNILITRSCQQDLFLAIYSGALIIFTDKF